MSNSVSDKQQLEGLRAIATMMSLEDFTDSVIVLCRAHFMTHATAESLISRFKLIKQGIL